jgi:hypothetical protein
MVFMILLIRLTKILAISTLKYNLKYQVVGFQERWSKSPKQCS